MVDGREGRETHAEPSDETHVAHKSGKSPWFGWKRNTVLKQATVHTDTNYELRTSNYELRTLRLKYWETASLILHILDPVPGDYKCEVLV